MASKNYKRTQSAALTLTLLSLSVASLMTISIPHNASAQGLPEGSQTQQGGQEVLGGAQETDTGIASLDDTTGAQPGGGAESSPCTPTQTAGASMQNATANTTTATTDGTGTMTINNNSITLGGDGATQSTSQIRDHIEQACIALEVGDTEGALMQLNFALGQLGAGSDDIQSNNTTTTSSSGKEGSFDEGVSVGGTGPFDDYDATSDAEAG